MHSVCPPNFIVVKYSWEVCIFPRAFRNNSLCKIWGANRVHYGQLENREWARVHLSKIKKGAFLHQDNTLDQAKTLTLNLCDPETVFKFHEVNPVLNSGEMVSTHLEPTESDVAGPLECANFN